MNIISISKFRIFTAILISVIPLYAYPADGNNGRILYISSYNSSSPTYERQVTGVKSVLHDMGIDLDIEFMDSRRFPEKELLAIFHNSLTYKLKRTVPYRSVIVADDAAFNYAVSQRNGIFRNTPVFFFGVNNFEKAVSMKETRNVRGVVESVSIEETINLIISLFPNRKKLCVVADNSITGREDLKHVLEILRWFPLKVEVLSLREMTFEHLKLRLKEPPGDEHPEYSILLLSAYMDINGEKRSFYSELSEIRDNSFVPIFHLWDHGIGQGIFGGKVISQYDQGRSAALMVRSYLEGMPLESIGIVTRSPNSYMFDYNELRRFDVPLNVLPENSVVINKPVPFLEKYRKIIAVSAAVMVFLLYMVVILLVQSRRLRHIVAVRTKELEESMEKWRFSLESAGQIVWDMDLRKETVFINRKWNPEFIITSDETLQPISEYVKEIHPEDREGLDLIMYAHLRGETPLYEVVHRVIGRDNTYRWVISRGKVIERNRNGKPVRVIGTATDITRFKNIEDEVRRSRRMLQLVLDTIPVGVFWKNRDLAYIGCSIKFLELAGKRSVDEIIGKNDEDIFGTEIAALFRTVDNDVMTTGKGQMQYEEDLVLPDQRRVTLRKSKVPLTDEAGEVIGVLGIYEDITLEKNLREENLRIQKLESVGILASGIAHDFNNLLMAVIGNLSLLKMYEFKDGKVAKWIDRAEKSCMAAADLTARLITFSRGGDPVLQSENITELINMAIEAVSENSPLSISYINRCSEKEILADPRQVRQVFINLIENAIESVGEDGVVEIISSDEILDEDNCCELTPGKYLSVRIHDNGHGISETIIDKIFDPYFSTKSLGSHKGQGLGLAICHSIVSKHKGKITVKSEAGAGTTFSVFLPYFR